MTETETAGSWWCQRVVHGSRVADRVRIGYDEQGRITQVVSDTDPGQDDQRLGLVVPGFGNAHSHLFHRGLRGRTHTDGGDFWQWRQAMYELAGALDPDSYRLLARATYAEMIACGYTAVGEFHYLHHRPDGTPYRDHAMERAIIDAADETGIRLTLLDTCYLTGGIGTELSRQQQRFGDGSADGWLERWHRLRDAVGERPGFRLGAALHSVRAVPADAIDYLADRLPPEIPVHIHLSEQQQENADCRAEYGCTPAELLHRAGALSPRMTAVHATHLTDSDIALLGDQRVTAAICPTTEADLGDGIGPARQLADAGASIATGSDQQAVIDPLLELRGLEAGERLSTGGRGVFDPGRLWQAGTTAGYASLGLGDHDLDPGSWCDLVELDVDSIRTQGSQPAQLALVATASDVSRTIVGGRPAYDRNADRPRPQELMAAALEALP